MQISLYVSVVEQFPSQSESTYLMKLIFFESYTDDIFVQVDVLKNKISFEPYRSKGLQLGAP